MDLLLWGLLHGGVLSVAVWVGAALLFTATLFGLSAAYSAVRDSGRAFENAFTVLMLSVAFGPVVVGLTIVALRAIVQ